MIGTTRQLRVYAHPQPADLRKGFEGLSALVRQGLGHDPLCGDMFLFVNRTRTLASLCIYAKRLE